MTLSKINSNLQTNQTWRGVVDAGIDQINTNTTAIATNATNIASNDTDIATNVTNIATNASNIASNLTKINDAILQSHKFVNITAGTSGDDIRALFEAQPRNLNGYSITFRFEAAAVGSQNTYDLGSGDTILQGFLGGNVVLEAYDFTTNTFVNEASTDSGTYRTKITGSNNQYFGIIQVSDSTEVFINDLAFEVTGTASNVECIVSKNSTVWVQRCQFKGIESTTTNTNSSGIRVQRGRGQIEFCYFSDLYAGIISDENSNVYARENNDYGNTIIRGQVAQKGGKISLFNSRINATADLVAGSGGLITDSNGLILSETVLTADKTVNITAGSSASTIQGLIDDQPKNLNGYNLTFTFAGSRAAPQVYNLGATQLNFDGFHGGQILVQGNSAETPTNRTGFVDISSASLASNVVTINTSSAHGLSTGDSVWIQNVEYTTTSPNGEQTSITVVDSDTFTFALTGANETYTIAGNSKLNANPPLGVKIQTQNSQDKGAMFFEKCTQVFVEHLEFEQTGNNDDSDILRFYYHTNGVVQYCIINNINTKGNNGVYYHQSTGSFANNQVNNLNYVLKAASGSTVSMVNIDLAFAYQYITSPNHKLLSSGGSIVTQGGTTVTGTIGQSVISVGGVVTPQAGIILDETVLTGTKTIKFASSNSSQSDKDAADVVFTGSNSTDLQNVINDQPKNLNGHTLNFQFADGTYDFGISQLQLRRFEGGSVYINGNLNNTLASNGTGLNVKIQTEITGGNGVFLIEECSRINVTKIAFEQNGTNTDTNLVVFRYSNDAYVESCSFNSLSGTTTNDAISIVESVAFVNFCGFNNINTNILAAQNSRVFSRDTFTFSGGTDASHNLKAQTGSIMTQTATQAGGADTKDVGTGGVIFNSSGALV